MYWAGIALLIAVGVAVGYLVHRRRGVRTKVMRSKVASYAEIKRRIRAGECADAAPAPVGPPIPEPAPLDDVFSLPDSQFHTALFERTAVKAQRNGDYALSASEVALVSVWGLEAEVNNGGFDQYFFNSAGDGAHEALAGLELVGAVHAAAIARRALALFGEVGPSRSREERWSQMDRWTPAQHEELDRLDDEFYEYPDPITDLMVKYCRSHRAEFEP